MKHYAGTVTYCVSGFVDKNRDTQQDVFLDHLSRSDNRFVQELTTMYQVSKIYQLEFCNNSKQFFVNVKSKLQENIPINVSSSPRPGSGGSGAASPSPAVSTPTLSVSTNQRGTSKGRPTVCDTFRTQLQQLVDVLQATNPWYEFITVFSQRLLDRTILKPHRNL